MLVVMVMDGMKEQAIEDSGDDDEVAQDLASGPRGPRCWSR
jgi:hypothetical protein